MNPTPRPAQRAAISLLAVAGLAVAGTFALAPGSAGEGADPAPTRPTR